MSEFGSFADGLMAMSLRGPIGPRVNLTKKRARALRHLLKEAVYSIPECRQGHRDDECHCNDDYHAAILWGHQQIQKRWSVFELVDDGRA